MAEATKAPTAEELVAAQNETIAAQNEKIESLLKTVAGLTASTEIKVEKAKVLTIPTKLVKVGGKEYKWSVPIFKMPGSAEAVTAEEAATDKDIIKAILAIEGQGLLVEQF